MHRRTGQEEALSRRSIQLLGSDLIRTQCLGQVLAFYRICRPRPRVGIDDVCCRQDIFRFVGHERFAGAVLSYLLQETLPHCEPLGTDLDHPYWELRGCLEPAVAEVGGCRPTNTTVSPASTPRTFRA